MLSLVRQSARHLPRHIGKAATVYAVRQQNPSACRAFSDVPKTMTVRCLFCAIPLARLLSSLAHAGFSVRILGFP